RLIEAGEEQVARAAHLDYYLALARRAGPHLLGYSDQSQWLDDLDQELTEIRSALIWGFGAAPAEASELATSLGWYWGFRGYVIEGLEWMETVLTLPSIGLGIRGAGLAFAGRMAGRQGAHRLAAKRFMEAIAIFRRLNDPPALAFAIFDLGTLSRATGHFARARTLLDTSLGMWRRLGDNRMTVYAIQELGVLAMVSGDYRRSEELFT